MATDSRDRWAERTVGEIIDRDQRAAAVFEHHGIDYCCSGDVRLSDACARAAVDLSAIASDLSSLRSGTARALPTTAWDLDQIVDYIVDCHHRYVRDTLPLLRAWCTRLVTRHGADAPELADIAALVEELDGELTSHFVKEEQILFPWLVRMARAYRERTELDASPFGTVLYPIRVMEGEHSRAEEIVGALRALTGNYEPPAGACLTWRLCWGELERFDADLRQHVHVENHVLFARALELERLLG